MWVSNHGDGDHMGDCKCLRNGRFDKRTKCDGFAEGHKKESVYEEKGSPH